MNVWLLWLLVLAARGLPQDRATSPSQSAGPKARPTVPAGASKRDPHSLKPSEPGRWKDFDAAKLAPADIPPGMLAVRDAMLDEDLPRTLEALYSALDATPDFPPALHQLGITYFRMQRYGDSKTVLERFLAVAPQRIGDSRVLGHDLYSLGRYDEARAHYERVLAAAPNDAEALRGLGLAHMRLGRADRALELLRRAVAIDPRLEEVQGWIAQILYEQDRTSEALEAALAARDLEPFQPRPWYLLSRILADLDRDAEARLAEKRFRELNGRNEEIRALEGALMFDPHQPALLERLVEARSATGNVSKTREALTRLLRQRPDEVRACTYALDVLERMGDKDGAKAAAQRLEEKAGSDAAAWKRLEAFYAGSKDRAKAEAAGEKYRRFEKH